MKKNRFIVCRVHGRESAVALVVAIVFIGGLCLGMLGLSKMVGLGEENSLQQLVGFLEKKGKQESLAQLMIWKEEEELFLEQGEVFMAKSQLPALSLVEDSFFVLKKLDENELFLQEAPIYEEKESEEIIIEPPVLQEGTWPIQNTTIVAKGETGYLTYENISVKNQTQYEIDIPALLEQKLSFSYEKDSPQVLILHTHATESYSKEGQMCYGEEDTNRSFLEEENLVGIGVAMEEALKERGIGVVHNKTVHDYPSYSGSYNNALATIEEELKKNPTITIVLDLHRDAIGGGGEIKYRTIVEKEGTTFAQVMLVMGTNEGGLTHDHWQENLAFGLRVQKNLNDQVENIARPLSITPQRYNEHMTPGSMLIEMGTSGNFKSDALASVPIVAEAIAKALKEG